MTTHDKSKTAADTQLRRRAEDRLDAKPSALHMPRSDDDAKRLVHELEVHQIELEMQNAELKRAQEELESSRNKYVELYDFAPVGYFTFDKQGLILEVNLTGAKLLGLERKLLLKRPLMNFIAQTAQKNIFSKHLKEVFQKQESATCDILITRKDGDVFYAHLQSVAVESIDGDTCFLRTTLADITDRIKAEEAVKFQADALAQVIDAVIAVDNEQRITYWNQAAEWLYNLKSTDVLGRPLEEAYRYKWHTAESERTCLASLQATGMWRGENIHVKKNGEEISVLSSVSVLKDDSGAPVGMLASIIDVTEHKKAEARIEHLASFPELDPNPVIEMDLQGKIIYYNTATTRVLKKLKLVTDDIHRLLPDDLTKVISQQEQEQEQEYDGRYAVREVDINGRTFIESVIVLAHLKVARIYAQDITRRKLAEDALLLAHDDLEKRVEERTVELREAISEIEAMKNQLEAENIYFRHENKMKHQFENIIGESDGLKYVLYRAQQVAPADTTVLILGETGTGKELIAAAIHSMSPRKERTLITVNCAALPATLIESELFGREKGAFTGADTRRMGRFELANGSTLCLDEIGELPLELQIKLLRVIQHHEFERLGSSHTVKVDVRIVATTNRDLEKEVSQGRFRQDLFYRLNVFPITVPPLRQRQEDIPPMVQAFVDRYARNLGKKITTISKETMKTLQDYPWPGNVRELESIIERAVILCPGPVLHLADRLDNSSPALSSAVQTLEETERNQIIKILSEAKWRIEGKDGAAAILGLNASTLRARMHKLGIIRPQTKRGK